MTVSFKKTDLTRAATAMLDAGLQLERVELGKDGRIVMFPKGAEIACSNPARGSSVVEIAEAMARTTSA